MTPLAQKLDPVTLSLLNAPVDDEPLTLDDLTDISASKEEILRGHTLTLEDLAKQLGIDLHD